jgi:hypothetical protein
MGMTWAAGWALVGVLVGVASMLLPGLPWDAFFEVFDAPLPALAVPGFVGGVLFSAVLGIAGRRRRFDELSLPRFAAWGAVGGLLLSLVPDTLCAVGLASRGPEPTFGPWELALVIGGPLMLLSAVSAAGSLALARVAERRELPDLGARVAEVGRTEGEPQELSGESADRAAWVQPAASDVGAPAMHDPDAYAATSRRTGRSGLHGGV